MNHPSSETSLTDDQPLFFTDRSTADEVAHLLDLSRQSSGTRREKRSTPHTKPAPPNIAGGHLRRLANAFPPLKENTK